MLKQETFFHSNDRMYMKKRSTDDPAFDQFWASYPRREGKLAAFRKWQKIKPTPELVEKILTALEWQCRRWTDPDFIPHASTYLHNARWEDEPPKKLGVPAPVWRCPHVQRCDNRDQCQQSTILGRARKGTA